MVSTQSTGRRRLAVEDRRGELLQACLQIIGTKPWDEVSMADVAAAAGASKPLLYHYFSTKSDLYLAAVRSAADELRAATNLTPTSPSNRATVRCKSACDLRSFPGECSHTQRRAASHAVAGTFRHPRRGRCAAIVSKPVLLAWGAADNLFPLEHAYRLRADFADARLEVIDRASTFVMLDRPDDLAAKITAFLSDTASTE